MRRTRAFNAPRWITARFDSTCVNSKCAKPIRKGDDILFDGTAQCKECGEQHQRDIAADDFDQAQYQSQYGGY